MTVSLMLQNQANGSSSAPAQSTSSNASRTSKISNASSITRGNIAAMKQELADEEARRKREDEMADMKKSKIRSD